MNKSKYYLSIYGTGFVASIFWTLLFNHWLFPLDYFLRMLSGILLFTGVITIFRNEPKSFTISFLVESIALMGLSFLKLPVISWEFFSQTILPVALVIGLFFISFYWLYIRPIKTMPHLNSNDRLSLLKKFNDERSSHEKDNKETKVKNNNNKMPTAVDYKRIKKEFEKELGYKCSDDEMIAMLTDILLMAQGFNPAGYADDELKKEYIRLQNLIRSGQVDGEESLSTIQEKFKLIKQEIKNRKLKIK